MCVSVWMKEKFETKRRVEERRWYIYMAGERNPKMLASVVIRLFSVMPVVLPASEVSFQKEKKAERAKGHSTIR